MSIYYNGSHNSPCKKKVYGCHFRWFCHNPTMMKTENQPTREDLIVLIIEHMVNQGIEHPEMFLEFLEDLKGYSIEGLYDVLLNLEENV